MENNNHASIWKRFGARFLDGIIFMVIFIIGFIIFNAFSDKALYYWNGFAYLLFLVYNIIMIANSGQTFGKKVMGIIVMNEDRQSLNIGRVILREVIAFFILYLGSINNFIKIPFINSENIIVINIVIVVIDLLPLILKKRTLHELLTSTKVVNED